MIVKRLQVGALGVNTYFLIQKNKECIVIDPGDDEQAILSFLCENGLKCKAVLLTHAHFDHSNGVRFLQKTGATVYMHEGDNRMLTTSENLAVYCGTQFNTFVPDIFVEHEKEYTVCDITFKVLHTPGHSNGSVCFVIGELMFSGDTLFYLSIGRTDFPGSSVSDMCRSLKYLFLLDCDYEVYPGHGPSTSLYFEKENNPYA